MQHAELVNTWLLVWLLSFIAHSGAVCELAVRHAPSGAALLLPRNNPF